MTLGLRGMGAIPLAPRPACFSYALSECLELAQPTSYPDCALIRGEVAQEPQGALVAHLQALPLCDTDLARVEQAMAYLPGCYSEQLDSCLNADDPALHSLLHCAEINAAYDVDRRIIDPLPYCESAPQEGVSWLVLGVSALGASVLGFFMGKLL